MNHSLRTPLALFIALLVSGCAATSDLPSRILFPSPPEEPRLEFIGVYGNEEDLKSSEADKLRRSILGSIGDDSFSFPSGIAVNSKKQVYVSDAMQRNIKIVDFDKKTIHSLFKRSPLARPIGINFDGEGRLYVADAEMKKVVVFAPDSEVVETTLAYEAMVKPAFVAINNKLNRVYVSDAVAQSIFVFNKEGKFLFRFGEGDDNGVGAIFGPQGLAVSPDNEVYVPELFNARISVFDADGKFLRSFGERGDSFWNFDHPKAIAFDSEGHLYIVDTRRGKVVIYTKKGELLMVLGGEPTLDLTGFAMPSAVTIDDRDRLYVADSLAKRISVWQYITERYKKEKPITAQELREIEDYMVRSGQRSAKDGKAEEKKP